MPTVAMVTGTEAGIRLYHTELIAIVNLALSSQYWSIKALGSSALVTMATHTEVEHAGALLKSALEALGVGRLWPGKVGVHLSCDLVVMCSDDILCDMLLTALSE